MQNYNLFFILILVADDVLLGPSTVAAEAAAVAHPYWRYWLAQE